MVDLDGDGEKELAVDLDGDGTPETLFQELLLQRLQLLDRDGDGVPDPVSAEELEAHLRAMQAWRESVRDRIQHGLPPFVDEDGDGAPDGRPEPFHRPWGPRGRGPGSPPEGGGANQ